MLRRVSVGGLGLGSPLPALEFLTTVRWRAVPVRTSGEVAASLWAFPLAGLLIGLALFGLERGGREIAPDVAVAGGLVLAWVLLTGGLHLDGLADTCDGLFGGHDREQRLSIMRDTATGVWGTIGIVVVLLLKFALLVSLVDGGRFSELVLAPLVGRGVIVGLMGAWPYARDEGFGKALHLAAWGAPAVVAGALTLLAAGLLWSGEGLLIVVWAGAVGGVLASYARRRLGGLTGDVDGALIEVLEVATLLAIVVGLEQDWLDPLLWDGS